MMTFKEMSAGVMLLGALVISGWVLREMIASPAMTLAEVATKLCWAIGASIVFNVVAVIVFTILVSIAQGGEMKDEKADERDWAIGAKAMRNAYVVASLAGLAALIVWALGQEATTGAYVLFGGLMLAGATDAASRLVYYRIG